MMSVLRVSTSEILFLSLLSLLILLCSPSTTNGLSYPFAENTPGTTNWNVLGGTAAHVAVRATGGAAMGIPPNRLMSDHGFDKSGNAYDCRSIIRQISDENRMNTAPEPEDVPRSTTTVKTYLSGGVIGIALVDVGAVGAPDVRAFYAPSGTTTAHVPTLDALAQTWLSQRVGFPVPLQTAAKWNIVRSQSQYTPNLMSHRRGNYVQSLPNVIGAEGTWSAVAPAAGATPEGIQFAFDAGRTTVFKKWGTAGWSESSLNVGGTCALQKLITTLYGFNEALPGAVPRLLPGAQSNMGAGSRLICVAEATHDLAKVAIKPWGSNVATEYPRGEEVPSCAVCQAVIPEIIDGSFGGCDVASLKPATLTVGNCPAYLSPFGGASCQLGCPQGKFIHVAAAGVLPTVTCVNGALVAIAGNLAHTCGAHCAKPAAVPTLTLGTCVALKSLKHGQTCQQGSKSTKPLLPGPGGLLTECNDGTLLQPHTFLQVDARITPSTAVSAEAQPELKHKLRAARQSRNGALQPQP